MEFVDFKRGLRGPGLDILFPGWREGERVAFYSPHDDDAVLGSGYLLQAVRGCGGTPLVLIFCRGDAGYSTPEAKSSIVAVRKAEALSAYSGLGVEPADIASFDIPDFALMETVSRKPGPLGECLFDRLVVFLRARGVSRVVFTSGHREHADHTAVFFHGIYTSPQAADPILADLGTPSPILSYLAYGVWTDFGPADSLDGLRADKGILAGEDEEQKVRKSLAAFASQGDILKRTVAARRDERRTESGYLELYQSIDIRAPVDFEPYKDALGIMRKP
jgi:LmbE family N-acetylglucosaminyl deacetylase